MKKKLKTLDTILYILAILLIIVNLLGLDRIYGTIIIIFFFPILIYKAILVAKNTSYK
ncbi:MAG: hypothetical protein GX753_02075 [Erysipelothrix sp.]|nr:hypothetical protein [Erysipelothrix sp.]